MVQSEIADIISVSLRTLHPCDTIKECGQAVLHVLAERPGDALQLAHERLHTWPYEHIPEHWRRLYEDACLHLVLLDLEDKNLDLHLIASVIKCLDQAIIVAGAPGRKLLIEIVMLLLQSLLEDRVGELGAELIHIELQEPLITTHNIHRRDQNIDIAAFQQHLDTDASPIIIPDVFEHWPARRLWNDVGYLRKQTLYGYRIVPVEVGSSYAEKNWTQRLMTFNEFADQYLLLDKPAKIGYLAQHDMFAQVPALEKDIQIPDYCWTMPPPPTGAAASTHGLLNTPQLDSPNLNAWLGPKGTKTPLHTDPYHNIFCQVVGYKYVRLYAPEESHRLYPHGHDEAGISMANTSQVDICKHRPGNDLQRTKTTERKIDEQRFPLLLEAKYQEAILGPGDCLYVPLGWWHYVEALTMSFSVSFWWN